MSDKPAVPHRGLTPKFIDAVKPRDRPYEIPDGGNGLVLRVEVSGAKSLRYHNRSTGLVATMPWSPTPTPGCVTLHEGREWLLRFKQARSGGRQQLESAIARLREQLSPTQRPVSGHTDLRSVRFVADQFYRLKIEPRYARPKNVRYIIDSYILPARPNEPGALPFGDRLIAQITPQECEIPAEYGIAQGARGAALHALKYTKNIFEFAFRRGYIPLNVAEGLCPSDFDLTKIPRSRILSDEELLVFWTALEPSGALVVPIVALRLILLTGVRVSQFCNALWQSVDLVAHNWTIPFADRKLRNKRLIRPENQRPFVVPLSSLAEECLAQLKHCSGGSRFVLPAVRSDKPRGYDYLDVFMQEYFGCCRGLAPRVPLTGGPLTVHDLRRTMRTKLTGPDLRVPIHIAERCLDHSLGGLIATYDLNDYLDERREAVEAWALYIENLLHRCLAGG